MAAISGNHTVKIYFPTGVPIVIKATPKTSILEVLKEACAKKKVNPDEYNLKYNKTMLDISSTIQFSRIPNNGRLDAVKSDIPRTSSNVKIRIQLENDERRQGEFSSDSNLQQILSDLNIEYNKDTAVIFYLQNKIHGKDFGTVTLSFLGLNSSGASLRLMHENPEKTKEQAHVYDIRIPSRDSELNNYPSARPSASVEQNPIDSEPNLLAESMDSSSLLPPTVQTNLIDMKTNENDEGMDCSPIPPSLQRHHEYNLDDLKKKSDNPSLPKKTLPKSEKKKAFDFMSAIKSEKEKRKTASEGNMTKLKKKEEAKPQKDEENARAVVADNARAVIEEEPAEASMNLQEPTIHILDEERQAVIFNKTQTVRVSEPELSDDFFNLTERDARVYLKGLRDKLKENDRPLMTEKLREAEKEQSIKTLLEKHPKTCIRIVINQEFELQGIFHSTELVKDIKNFVKSYLADPTNAFSLYIPPRIELNDEKSLLEENLVPRAKVHCTRGCDIDPKFKTKLTDSWAANKIRLNKDSSDLSEGPTLKLY